VEAEIVNKLISQIKLKYMMPFKTKDIKRKNLKTITQSYFHTQWNTVDETVFVRCLSLKGKDSLQFGTI
jgi:hypothetical protein